MIILTFFIQIVLLVLLPIWAVAYLFHYFGCSRNHSTILYPYSIIFHHCHIGALYAANRCLIASFFAGIIPFLLAIGLIFFLKLEPSKEKDIVILAYAIPGASVALYRGITGKCKMKKFRDIYN